MSQTFKSGCLIVFFLVFSFRQQGEKTEVDINEGTVKLEDLKKKEK